MARKRANEARLKLLDGVDPIDERDAGRAKRKVEAAKAIFLQPLADDLPGERLAPATLGAHPTPHRRGRQQNACCREWKEHPRLKPKRLSVAAFEGIKKMPIPQIEQHLHQQLQ